MSGSTSVGYPGPKHAAPYRGGQAESRAGLGSITRGMTLGAETFMA